MNSRIFLMCACYSLLTHASIETEVLPKGRPFRLTTADPREIQMSLAFHSHERLDAAIGNYFSLIGFGEKTWRIHGGFEGAGYFTMRQKQKRFPLETTDGLIGVYMEGNLGRWQNQLRFTHLSAHFSDGNIGTPIAYSRESIILRSGYLVTDDFHIYGGFYFPVHAIPTTASWHAQAGFSFFWMMRSHWVVPFTALDVHWRRESPYDPSGHFELGLALNNPPESYRSFRIFYSLYVGADPRGQYYLSPLTAHSIGVEMQI